MSAIPCTPARNLVGHAGPVFVVKYTREGNYILSGGQDRTIQLWNPETGLNIKTYPGHNKEVLSVDVLADNSQFVSCGGDKYALLWDVTSARILRSFRGHAQRINDVKFSRNDSVLFTASYDRSVCCWDMRSRSGAAMETMADAKDSVTCLCVGEYTIYAGSVDGYVRAYDIRNAKLREDCMPGPVTSLSVSRDEKVLLISTLDQHVRLLDTDTGKLLNTYKGHMNTAVQIKMGFTYSEAHVVGGSEDGKVYYWDMLTGKVVHTRQAHKGIVTSVSCHPSQPKMVSSSLDSSIIVWNTD